MEDAEISPEKESTRVHQRNVWIVALVSGTLCVAGGFCKPFMVALLDDI